MLSLANCKHESKLEKMLEYHFAVSERLSTVEIHLGAIDNLM